MGTPDRAVSGITLSDEIVVTAKEPIVLLTLRIVVLVVISIIAGLLGAFAWGVLREVEVRRFEADYEYVNDRLGSQIKTNAANVLTCLEDTASTIEFPNARTLIARFERTAKLKMQLCNFRTVSLSPIVPVSERQLFEDWAKDNAEAIAASWNVSTATRLRIVDALGKGIQDVRIQFAPNRTFIGLQTFNASDEALPAIAGIPAFFVPNLQFVPVNAGSVLFNVHNFTNRRKMIEKALRFRTPAATGFDLSTADILNGLPLSPMISVVVPIFSPQQDFNLGTPAPITGGLACHLTFISLLKVDLAVPMTVEVVITSRPSNSNIDLAAYNLPGLDPSIYTFIVRGGIVESVGFGDRKASGLDSYKRELSFSVAGSDFDVAIYPTDDWYATYLTATPRDGVLGAVLLTLGIACVFFVFDIFSRRHLNRVFQTAAVTSAEHAADREKLRGRHAFVSMISHEIRTPASAIAGALDLLLTTDITDIQKDLLVRLRMRLERHVPVMMTHPPEAAPPIHLNA